MTGCHSARMSKITNFGLTRSATGCFIAVSIWQQWAFKGLNCHACRVLLSRDQTNVWAAKSWASWWWFRDEISRLTAEVRVSSKHTDLSMDRNVNVQCVDWTGQIAYLVWPGVVKKSVVVDDNRMTPDGLGGSMAVQWRRCCLNNKQQVRARLLAARSNRSLTFNLH